MTDRPLITIGIPVYNGELYIGITLQSIIDSLQGVFEKNKIEILVSDNKSIDKTLEIVKSFSNDCIIQYHCNKVNIGYDGNIDAIVKRSNGKYVWFLGCGERVKMDSLSRLLKKLDNDIEYENILLDFDIYDESRCSITNKRVFDFDNDVLLEGKNNFKYNKYGSAVSSNIINREKWLQVIDKDLVVNGWCHIERILNIIALNNNSKTLLLAYPYFTLYREKDGWWTKTNSYLLLLLLLHINVIRSMLKMGYDKEVVNRLEYSQSRLALIGAVVQSKSYGLKIGKKLFSDLFKIFKYDYFFWLFVIPLLLLPNRLIIIPRMIWKFLKLMRKVLNNV
ncbi:glycosyltransferase family 2 protein [Campylobacter sp. 7477a]|uniref:glycosyltransferase family 2 protein n=1 Tax=Campylobacter sp. 7477a TaxID=2735741 RepID=UPI003014DC3E|nr:glycosyltransferase family 2 protein [Campylobacter sp. 7477a]